MLTAISQLDYSVKQSIVILASLFLSLIIAYLTTPLAIKFARKIDAVDVPTDNRRMHTKPIPLLGGLAIIVAFLVTSTVLTRYHRLLWQILPGALIIALLGVIDDRHPLPAWPKLLVQCVAAALPTIINPEIIIESISGFNIFGINTIHFGAFAIPITILWIVGITNAVNFIDGLDGLAAGISTIASLSMLTVAVIKMSVDPNEYSVAILTAALAGGCLGILPYNKNPAKVFLGDTGATFLGYTLAVISIQGLFKAYTTVSFAVPILVLGLPILDVCAAVTRRLKKHKSPFTADRCHIHHKLIDMGLDQKQAVGLLYCISTILGISAIIFAAFGSSTGWLFLLGAIGLIVEICILAIPVCDNTNNSENVASPDDVKANEETVNADNTAGRTDEDESDGP